MSRIGSAFTINAWCLHIPACIVALPLPETCGALSHDSQEIIQNPGFLYYGQAICLKAIVMSIYEGAI
jgi:hypothetical protein